jgi:hypothetical protein
MHKIINKIEDREQLKAFACRLVNLLEAGVEECFHCGQKTCQAYSYPWCLEPSEVKCRGCGWRVSLVNYLKRTVKRV